MCVCDVLFGLVWFFLGLSFFFWPSLCHIRELDLKAVAIASITNDNCHVLEVL